MLKKGVKQSSGREINNIVGGEKKQEFQIRCGENFVSRDTRIAPKMTELFQATKSRNDKENRQRDVDPINEHDYSDSVQYTVLVIFSYLILFCLRKPLDPRF